MEKIADVIVIGAGAVGIATTYQLAKRKVKVLCLDQFPFRHTEGSSHGESRITRKTAGEHRSLPGYAIRSHQIWDELQKDLGYLKGKLFERTGVLIIGGLGNGFNFSPDLFGSTLRAAMTHNIDHRIFSADEMRLAFPLLQVADNEQGYFEYGAGVLFPENCLAAQLTRAHELGAKVHHGIKVLAVRERNGAVEIDTSMGTFSSARCVIAPGAYINEFLPTKYHKLFTVTRQTVFHFVPCADHEKFKVGRMPAFIWEGRDIYGFPSFDGKQAKVAFGSPGRATDPLTVDRAVHEDEVEAMRWVLKEWVPSLAGKLSDASTCLYTNTPDGNFVMDRHPDMRNVFVASACSGHGFKHSAAVGELMAELAVPSIYSEDMRLDEFSLARFRI